MKEKHRGTTAAAACLAAIASLVEAGPAVAQAYPSRTITIIASTAPGGPGDIAARLVSDRLGKALGQTIVVENVAGAGGIQGTARVARAAPDGYTLLVQQTGIAIAPSISGNLSFDAERDLTAVGLLNTSYLVLVGRGDMPAGDLDGLTKWMRTPGNRARIAHPGVGTLGHVSTLVFARTVGAEIDAVPYRGIAPAVNDLLGSHVDLIWLGAVAAGPLIEAGKIKGYVVGGPKRLPAMPNVPAAPEVKLPSLDMPFWHALFAPSATPQEIVSRLDAALRETLADPDVIASYGKSGVEAFPLNMRSPEVANAFFKSEIARWRGIAPAPSPEK